MGWNEDPVLQRLIREAAEAPSTVGLILSGSRGAGCAGPESDYDIEWVLIDAAYTARQERGEPLSLKKTLLGSRLADHSYTCPRELEHIGANPGWWTSGYATARVLLDKTGEVTLALERIATMPEEKAKADA